MHDKEYVTKKHIESHLNANWTAISSRAAARAARYVIWERRLAKANRWLLTATILLLVQSGLLLCLGLLKLKQASAQAIDFLTQC